MRALVCYESMYGNTRQVAEAIGAGLRAGCDVTVIPVGEVGDLDLGQIDLLVVGAPTHVHGLPRPASRHDAATKAGTSDSRRLEAGAEGPGVREWLEGLDHLDARVVAFDTRVDMSPILTGRASKGLDKRLRRAGGHQASPPESFLVDKEDTLLPGVAARATEWGARLVAGRGADAP